MRTKKHKKLIWADIHEKDNQITPWYYFEFDRLNEMGFPDSEMLAFIEEMKTCAQKEMEQRKNKPKNSTPNKDRPTGLCDKCVDRMVEENEVSK